MPYTLEDKLSFLRNPASYQGEASHQVDVIETYLSWVFLVDRYVYKMKKPVKLDYLDFSTLEARYLNCQNELRLNRRLAASIYLQVIPLSVTKTGNLSLLDEGIPIEWLIKMRRLPGESMLDVLMLQHKVGKHDFQEVARCLVNFYERCQPISMKPAAYRTLLKERLLKNKVNLQQLHYGFSLSLIEKINYQLEKFVRSAAELFDERIRQAKIVEGHGDLRPEHICLEAQPIIIDCLEFNQELRTLDIADDLAYLAMECEYLGNTSAGQVIYQTYQEISHDIIPDELIMFYKCSKACVRAWLSMRHLDSPRYQMEATKWKSKANRYLEIAECYANVLFKG